MTRTKNWLLVGTILPAIALSQAGGMVAAAALDRFTELAQAQPPADDQPGQPRRERAPGVPRAPGGPAAPGAEGPAAPRGSGAPPAIQRPSAPQAPTAAPPAAPRAPAPAEAPPPRAAPEPRRDPPMPRPAPSITAPQPGQPAARPLPVPPVDGAPSVRPTPPRPPTAAPERQSPAERLAPTQRPAPPAAAPADRRAPAAAPAAPPAPQPAPQNRTAPAPAAPAPAIAPTAPTPPVVPQPRTVPVAPAQPPAAAPQAAPPPPAAPPAIAPAPAPSTAPAPAPQAAPAAPPAPPTAPPPARRDGQTQATPPAAPGVTGQPVDPRQGRRGGIGLGGAAAIGLGAGVIGGIMATQGAERLEDVRGRREERREGDVTIIREPGRTIIRDDDRTIIRRDETQRFRDLGLEARTERRGDENRTVFERADGTRIVTITDEEGRLIRRTRLDREGREVVIIDNTRRDRPRDRFSDEIVVLERPALRIPPERYIVDADQADENLIYDTIVAPPLGPIPRRYTLDEVRYSPDLRAQMRSVDIDTVTFATGSWDVAPGQAQRLSVIADSIRRALQASPNEVFLVEGHTDAVGAEIDNLSLSDRRAQSVAEILTKDFGVPPENLTTQGYGEQYLKVNTQDAARENRRVTLRRITPLLAGQGG
jgi:outer membrane protein OmpA-like peptidoglycan-associated protein